MLERFPLDLSQGKALQFFVYRIFFAKPVSTLAENALAALVQHDKDLCVQESCDLLEWNGCLAQMAACVGRAEPNGWPITSALS